MSEKSIKSELHAVIEKMTDDKCKGILDLIEFLARPKEKTENEVSPVMENKYKINPEEAWKRLFDVPGYKKSTSPCSVTEIGNEFMQVITGKTYEELKDWFLFPCLEANPELRLYFLWYLYDEAYKAGYAAACEKSKKAKDALIKRKRNALKKAI